MMKSWKINTAFFEVKMFAYRNQEIPPFRYATVDRTKRSYPSFRAERSAVEKSPQPFLQSGDISIPLRYSRYDEVIVPVFSSRAQRRREISSTFPSIRRYLHSAALQSIGTKRLYSPAGARALACAYNIKATFRTCQQKGLSLHIVE
jgi:hypothetical protein